jgi:hypothetical protein
MVNAIKHPVILSGMFSKAEFNINQTVRYQMRSYLIQSVYKIQVFYYPTSRKLIFKNGFHSINSDSCVLQMLKSSGYKSVAHFLMVHMQSAEYDASSACIWINYYNFNLNCIFTK